MTNPATPEGGTPRDFGEAFHVTPDTETPAARWDELTPGLGDQAPNVLNPAPLADTSERRGEQLEDQPHSGTQEAGIGSLQVDSSDGTPRSMAEVWDSTAAGLDNLTRGADAGQPEVTASPPAPTTESTSVQEPRPTSTRPTPQQRLFHAKQHKAERRQFFPRRGQTGF